MSGTQIEPIGPEIWVADGAELRFIGLMLGTRSTIVRLGNGAVWIHSPIKYSTALAGEIEKIVN